MIEFEKLTYWDCLKLAQETEPNLNHAGWIIYENSEIKYILDTLDEGKSFRISHWNAGERTGLVDRVVATPKEIEFLFSLRWDDND